MKVNRGEVGCLLPNAKPSSSEPGVARAVEAGLVAVRIVVLAWFITSETYR